MTLPATRGHKAYFLLKRLLPAKLATIARSMGTLLYGPFLFATSTGYARSCLRCASVDKYGREIPWYTYPLIDELLTVDFSDKQVFEFGAGHSTVWWSKRARKVIALEKDKQWIQKLNDRVGPNVELYHVSKTDPAAVLSLARRAVSETTFNYFDVVIIDGPPRAGAVHFAIDILAANGVIICDNAEEFSIHQAFRDTGFLRVDFIGMSPGTSLPQNSAVYFRSINCFMFQGSRPMCDPSRNLR